MPKVNVDITLATHEEVAAVLADFGITGLQKFRKVMFKHFPTTSSPSTASSVASPPPPLRQQSMPL